MQTDNDILKKLISQDLLELIIRVGLIAFVVYFCIRIISPFATLLLWALILAVAIYPLHQRLAIYLKHKQGTTATAIVILGLLIIAGPSILLINSLVDQMHTLTAALESSSFALKQPDQTVAQWPLVGEKIYAAWSSAAADLPAFLESIQPQLVAISKAALSFATGMAASTFVFLVSFIIAGVMMAYGESGAQVMRRISIRLAGPDKGPKLYGLSTATIRSVATGVIGVAFIQALLLGIGFMLAGIPAAGLLAIVALIFGIAQLPAMLLSLPAIAFIWWTGDMSTTINVLLTLYLLVAAMADNVLKPILLGRGVEAPMPVILLGALGGMIMSGIIGLFIGAVLLAVGYIVFMEWVDHIDEAIDTETNGPEEPSISL